LVFATLLSFASCKGDDKEPTTNNGGNTDNSGDQNNDQNNEQNGENNTDNPPSPVDPREEVTVKQMLQTLATSPYTNNIKPDREVVIDDVSKLGVDKEKFDNELLYPYPADSEFGDRIYVVTDRGVVKDGDKKDGELSKSNTASLNLLLRELKDVEGKKKLVFPQGNYYFSGTWNITDIDDLYICSDEYGKFFNIVFTSWMNAIQVSGGSNLHLRDYTLTYDPSSAVGGEIVRYSMADKTITVKIYEEFDMTHKLYNGGIFPSTHSYVEFVWDDAADAYIPDPKGNLLYDHMVDSLRYDNDTRELVLKVTNATMIEPTVGKRVNVAYTEHQYFGFSASKCKSIYLEHINIYTTCGMGF
jgi:hypothetical protein